MSAFTIQLVIVVLALVSHSYAKSKYIERLPNVPADFPAVGHMHANSGSGSLNPFGRDFERQGKQWTVELCRLDSDNDGLTNGQELGDPNCVWRPGMEPEFTFPITNPGVAEVAWVWQDDVTTPSPSSQHSQSPSVRPTSSPSNSMQSPEPTASPSRLPSESSSPSSHPTLSRPSSSPSPGETQAPSLTPSVVTSFPSSSPSSEQTQAPSLTPSAGSSLQPTSSPFNPSSHPTSSPSLSRSQQPTLSPSSMPTPVITQSPTLQPTRQQHQKQIGTIETLPIWLILHCLAGILSIGVFMQVGTTFSSFCRRKMEDWKLIHVVLGFITFVLCIAAFLIGFIQDDASSFAARLFKWPSKRHTQWALAVLALMFLQVCLDGGDGIFFPIAPVGFESSPRWLSKPFANSHEMTRLGIIATGAGTLWTGYESLGNEWIWNDDHQHSVVHGVSQVHLTLFILFWIVHSWWSIQRHSQLKRLKARNTRRRLAQNSIQEPLLQRNDDDDDVEAQATVINDESNHAQSTEQPSTDIIIGDSASSTGAGTGEEIINQTTDLTIDGTEEESITPDETADFLLLPGFF